MSPSRAAVLERLADLVAGVQRRHIARVAIDGVDAAGKTTLADELEPLLVARGRSVLRATVDDFHRPRSERRRRGPTSPEGYYRDAFDYEALRRYRNRYVPGQRLYAREADPAASADIVLENTDVASPTLRASSLH